MIRISALQVKLQSSKFETLGCLAPPDDNNYQSAAGESKIELKDYVRRCVHCKKASKVSTHFSSTYLSLFLFTMSTMYFCLHEDHMALTNMHKMAAKSGTVDKKISGIGSYQDKNDEVPTCSNARVL